MEEGERRGSDGGEVWREERREREGELDSRPFEKICWVDILPSTHLYLSEAMFPEDELQDDRFVPGRT